jgi:hypothetical protein
MKFKLFIAFSIISVGSIASALIHPANAQNVIPRSPKTTPANNNSLIEPEAYIQNGSLILSKRRAGNILRIVYRNPTDNTQTAVNAVVNRCGRAVIPNAWLIFASGGLRPVFNPNFTINAPLTVTERNSTNTINSTYQVQPGQIQRNVTQTFPCIIQ